MFWRVVVCIKWRFVSSFSSSVRIFCILNLTIFYFLIYMGHQEFAQNSFACFHPLVEASTNLYIFLLQLDITHSVIRCCSLNLFIVFCINKSTWIVLLFSSRSELIFVLLFRKRYSVLPSNIPVSFRTVFKCFFIVHSSVFFDFLWFVIILAFREANLSIFFIQRCYSSVST